MNESYPWFGLVHRPQLEQGDFFVACPIFRPGNIPGYHLLNRCNLTGFETDYLICDFRSLFGVHLTTLNDLAAQQSPRLRLLPP